MVFAERLLWRLVGIFPSVKDWKKFQIWSESRSLRGVSWWFTKLLGSFPVVIWCRLPYWEGRERQKKEADHSRLVGGRFHTEIYLTRLVLCRCRTSRFLHLPAGILKVYIEVLTGFSRVHSLDNLITTFLFQGFILGAASGSGGSKGRDAVPPTARVQLAGQTSGHVFSVTSPNTSIVPSPDLCETSRSCTEIV